MQITVGKSYIVTYQRVGPGGSELPIEHMIVLADCPKRVERIERIVSLVGKGYVPLMTARTADDEWRVISVKPGPVTMTFMPMKEANELRKRVADLEWEIANSAKHQRDELAAMAARLPNGVLSGFAR